MIESGTRDMCCCGHDYIVGCGDVILLSPNDSHGCVQADGCAFDYRGLNISQSVMLELTEAVAGEGMLPRFSANVIQNNEIRSCILQLHNMIMSGWKSFERKETLYTLISLIIEQFAVQKSGVKSNYADCIELAIRYISEHYSERITLQQLCDRSHLSKSTLLREFTRIKGVTPYRYLQAVRINKAKELLEVGVPQAEVALMTGFFDQSHFSNTFTMFIGLPPAEYNKIFRENK